MLLIKAKKRKPEIGGEMKNFIWLTPVVLSCALVLPACDKAQNEPAPRSESAPNIGAPKTSDADLEKAVRAKLKSDDAIK